MSKPMIEDLNLHDLAGKKITMFWIDGVLAMSHETRMTITRAFEKNGKIVIAYKEKGKRKEKGLYWNSESVYLEGWDFPFCTDSEWKPKPVPGMMTTQLIHGNACLNLVGENIQDLYSCIGWKGAYDREDHGLPAEGKLLFPITDEARGSIIFYTESLLRQSLLARVEYEGMLAYPHIYTNHAVVEQMKNR